MLADIKAKKKNQCKTILWFITAGYIDNLQNNADDDRFLVLVYQYVYLINRGQGEDVGSHIYVAFTARYFFFRLKLCECTHQYACVGMCTVHMQMNDTFNEAADSCPAWSDHWVCD